MPHIPAVEVDHLSVRFGDHVALRNISFRAEKGGLLAIVGPNGSGKTTLLKAVLGLVAPVEGTVRVMGKPPQQIQAGRVGYVPQIKTLDRSFPAHAVELVLSGLQRRWPHRASSGERRRALQALERVDAESLAQRPLSKLSGGELQRVYLARSLVREPELVILDEPATGVDTVGALSLYDLLDDYLDRHDAAVLMVTHDWNAAYHHAAQVLVLDCQQVSFGSPEQALSSESLRQAFGHVGHAHAMLVDGGEHG